MNMANEKLNKSENAVSSSESETQDIDISTEMTCDEIERFGGELKDFNERSSAKTNQMAESENGRLEVENNASNHSDKKSVGSDHRSQSAQRRRPENSHRPRPDDQRRRPENGHRPRPDDQRRRPENGHRPRPDDQRRRPENGHRPRPDDQRRRPENGHRPRPDDQRRRPENGHRPRPDDQRRRPENGHRPRPDDQRRRSGNERSSQVAEKKNKGWTKKKKAVLITVTAIVLTIALIAAVVLILFFSYTGKLNRDPDTKVNSGARPVDSSELVSKPDTITQEDQLAKLRDMLSKRSKPINNENVMNILIVGEDLRDTTTGERGNTDVQMLVSINKEKKKIVLASFLRDQYLDINGYGMARLNTAYWHEGIPLLKDTISQYYNVHIDRYILVNFYSFIDVIDSIGGVDMDIDQDEFAAINETIREHNKYLNNPETKDYIKQPGKQHLNGNQALGYSRIREGCGDDYGRTERQREMITAVIAKIKSLGLIELDSLINKVAPQITTDITDGEIASLILNAAQIAGYQICQVQMPHFPYFKEEVIDQMAVLVPDYDKCCTLLLDMIYGDSTTVEQAVEKMEAGIINQYTYSIGGSVQGGQDTGGGQDQNFAANADPDTGQPAQQQY